MDKRKTLLILAFSALLLGGCAGKESPAVSSSPEGGSASLIEGSSGDSSGSSADEAGASWSEEAKALLQEYCGEVLPYPEGFLGDEVHVKEEEDSEGVEYLQIYVEGDELYIEDYHEQLSEANWEIVRDYNGKVGQVDSEGYTYYEAVKDNGGVGYDIQYFLYEDSYYQSGTYNLIECYNSLASGRSEDEGFSASAKKTFESTIAKVPPMLELGEDYLVYSYSDDVSFIRDTLADNNASDNAKRLEDDGWKLEKELSEKNGSYILSSSANDGGAIYASLYYFRGNYVCFSYSYEESESSSWPSSFVGDFEGKAGISLPEFGDAGTKEYHYYAKKGVFVIYASVEDDSAKSDYASSLESLGAVYDSSTFYYSDWEEKWFVKPEMKVDDETGDDLFMVSFGVLGEPYDELLSAWPGDKIDSFLASNDLGGVEVPSFDDLLSYSGKSVLRVSERGFGECYEEALTEVSLDPSSYGIDGGKGKKAIEEAAKDLAKSRAGICVKAYDGGEAKAYAYLLSSLKQAGWARVRNTPFDLAYEDPEGKVLLGLTHGKGVTSVTFTYGSSEAHEAAFYFDPSSVCIEAGESLQLELFCDIYKGEIAFSSSDGSGRISVDQSGLVKASSDATGEAVITAILTPQGSEEKIEAECIVTVNEIWDAEKTGEAICSLYNGYFNLDEGDEGFAKAEAQSDGIYLLTLKPSGFTSLAQGEELVTKRLIPSSVFGNTSEGEWQKGSLEGSQTACERLDYIAYNEDGSEVDMSVLAYFDDDGAVTLRFVISDC